MTGSPSATGSRDGTGRWLGVDNLDGREEVKTEYLPAVGQKADTAGPYFSLCRAWMGHGVGW